MAVRGARYQKSQADTINNEYMSLERTRETSIVYEELGEPNEVTLQTGASSELRRDTNRDGGNEARDEVILPNQQDTNQHERVPDTNKDDQNERSRRQRRQQNTRVLVFVVVELVAIIVVTGYFGYEVAQQKDSIAELQAKVLQNDFILFRARDLTYPNNTDDRDLIFKTALQNEGGGYDPKTGVFTIPITGTYLFTAEICVAKYFHLFLQIDDHKVQYFYLHNGDAECHTVVLFYYARQGSAVKLTSLTGLSTLSRKHLRENMFCGVLLNT